MKLIPESTFWLVLLRCTAVRQMGKEPHSILQQGQRCSSKGIWILLVFQKYIEVETGCGSQGTSRYAPVKSTWMEVNTAYMEFKIKVIVIIIKAKG